MAYSLGDVAEIYVPKVSTAPTTAGAAPSPESTAMHAGFVGALTKLQQKARATGGAAAPSDLAEVARGYFGEAGERLYKKRALDVEERAITSAEEMQWANLAVQVEIARQQLISAEEQYEMGLISAEKLEEARLALEREKIAATEAMHAEEIELGYYEVGKQSKAAKKAAEESGGLFGGGGILGLGCIIITACTSPDSHEVNIAREYRDKWLGVITLAGYYALSHKVAPLIAKSKTFKRLVKKLLVDRLTDYFEWFLEYKPRRRLCTSRCVTKNFLGFCRAIGYLMSRQKAIEHLAAHVGRTSPVA